MTWLTPLFLAAGLSVVGPILFHMWQRTPRGRRLFSSTMFLSASPPRITHRSRIENWPLLLLRALALVLLAVGFARPVWRTASQAPTITSPGKTVAILVDVSASLQRHGLWDSVIPQVQQRLDQLPANTQIGLFTFDHQWMAQVSLDEAYQLDSSARRQIVRDRLSELKPGWGSTQLGNALAQTMQTLLDFETARPVRERTEIWLVTDMTSGADLTGLAGIDWPESTELELITPNVAAGSNAGLQWVESRTEAKSAELRVRITNEKQSEKDRFHLTWDDPLAVAERLEIHVPQGQSRTILAPARPKDLAETVPLRLLGDDHEFDNRLWTAEIRKRAVWILYLGDDSADDPTGPRFFLEQALADTSDAEIVIRTVHDLAGAELAADPPPLTVWTDTGITPPDWLQSVLRQGGSLLAVPRTADDVKLMLAYQGTAATDVQEAEVKDFSLLSDIDFEDPLFATFAQARFADFTGIHFWKHRQVQFADLAAVTVLARFDDGHPFLTHHPVGDGRMWLLTSGWQPVDSQLARSSKFAPLLHRFLEQSTRLTTRASRSPVGSEILWPMLRGQGPISVRRPDGRVIERSDVTASSRQTDVPGLYVATQNGETETWAINVAAEESKTDPLPVETLERLGVPTKRSPAGIADVPSPIQQRQLQLVELERRQSWWRWCLLAAGLVLLLETALASRKSRLLGTQPST